MTVNEPTFEAIQQANATIKTTRIKNKEYAEVAQRIKAFRMVYPGGYIETALIGDAEGVCMFRAEVGFALVLPDGNYIKRTLGTGTAFERQDASSINRTSYIENCETSAVGRALGMAGFGIDTSIASAEEVANAIAQQESDSGTADDGPQRPPEPTRRPSQPKPAPELPPEALKGFTALKDRLAKARGVTGKDAAAELVNLFGNPRNMDAEQFESMMKNGETYVAAVERKIDAEDD